MRYNLSKKGEIQRIKTRLNFLYKKGATIEIVEKRKQRTRKQNNYLHLILTWFAIETGYTLEEIKQDIFKRDVCKDFFEYEKGDRTFYRSTTDLDTGEMTLAIEKFRNWSSNTAGIYLPSSDERELLNRIEEEMQMYGNRQYI